MEFLCINQLSERQFDVWCKESPYTHPIHQLPHHPVPDFGLCVPRPIFSITDYFQLVLEAAVLCNLRRQIYAVTLVALIVDKKVGILFQHHVWSFLKDGGEKEQ